MIATISLNKLKRILFNLHTYLFSFKSDILKNHVAYELKSFIKYDQIT
jgi:hypothetical protein